MPSPTAAVATHSTTPVASALGARHAREPNHAHTKAKRNGAAVRRVPSASVVSPWLRRPTITKMMTHETSSRKRRPAAREIPPARVGVELDPTVYTSS